MVDLKNLIESGIINDLLKAEKAFNIIKSIGERKDEINQSDTHIINTLSYFQNIAVHEFVLGIARVYDKPNQNKTRCLPKLIDLLIRNSESFPRVIETYQTERQLNHFNLSHLVYLLKNREQTVFTKQLGIDLHEQFLKLKNERKIIKSWRDRILTHNDKNNKVESIHFQDTNKLLEFGWQTISIIGWAYLNTVYGIEGRYSLREDIQRQRLQIDKFLQITLNSA